MMFQKGLGNSKLDTNDVIQDLDELNSQLEKIESNYLQSIQEQSSSEPINSEQNIENKDTENMPVNLDYAIKQLILTNKLTLSKLNKVNELIIAAVNNLEKHDSPLDDPTVKLKEYELHMMQLKCVKIKSKIDSIHLKLQSRSETEQKYEISKNSIIQLDQSIKEHENKKQTLIRIANDQRKLISKKVINDPQIEEIKQQISTHKKTSK